MLMTIGKNNILQVIRFGLVGISATLVHAGVGVTAVNVFGTTGLEGNVIGFLVAWSVSFFGHHQFTFSAQADRLKAFMRFVPHSLAMFLIALFVTYVVSIGVPGIPEFMLPVMGAFIVPVISFLSSKFFVFKV